MFAANSQIRLCRKIRDASKWLTSSWILLNSFVFVFTPHVPRTNARQSISQRLPRRLATDVLGHHLTNVATSCLLGMGHFGVKTNTEKFNKLRRSVPVCVCIVLVSTAYSTNIIQPNRNATQPQLTHTNKAAYQHDNSRSQVRQFKAITGASCEYQGDIGIFFSEDELLDEAHTNAIRGICHAERVC